MPTPVTLFSDQFARLMVCEVFTLIEQHLNIVVKVYAQQKPEWKDTWLWELKQCVGPKSQDHMKGDKDWDVYVLFEILKKLFRKVYRERTCYSMDEDATCRLFNQIHQVAYIRNLLNHNFDPTISEIASCVEACCEIVGNFPPPEGHEANYDRIMTDLCEKKEVMNGLLLLECDEVYRNTLEVNYCYLLLDNMLALFEKLLGPPLESTFEKRGQKCKKTPPDVQFIVEVLMNVPTQKATKQVFKGRRQTKDKAKKIDTTEEQIDKAFQMASQENVSAIDRLVFDGIITLGQAQEVRTELGEGKHIHLVKVIHINPLPYSL